MPNVTLFIPSDRMPADHAVFNQFLAECTDLCTGTLGAALDKVHIMFSPTLQFVQGQDAYIEVKYRLETKRTAEVMRQFMEELDRTFTKHFSLVARIRCFGSTYDAIHALN